MLFVLSGLDHLFRGHNRARFWFWWVRSGDKGRWGVEGTKRNRWTSGVFHFTVSLGLASWSFCVIFSLLLDDNISAMGKEKKRIKQQNEKYFPMIHRTFPSMHTCTWVFFPWEPALHWSESLQCRLTAPFCWNSKEWQVGDADLSFPGQGEMSEIIENEAKKQE